MELKDRLGKELIIFDGAMGTILQKRGLKAGDYPERLNIEKSKEIIDIHKSYLKAGAEIITTNTFGANDLKMKKTDYSVNEIIYSAINNAKIAVKESNKEAKIALDMGPLGELIEPIGSLSFDNAYNLYKKQVLAAVKNEVDLIHIETISDLNEARAAVLAAKENSNFPVFCTLSFEKNGRTFTGGSIRSMIAILEGLGVDALGINCSLGPKQLEPLVEELLKYAELPVILQANAGLPEMKDGKTIYTITPEEYIKPIKRLYKKGLAVVGGCCGTNEDFIKLIANNLKGKTVKKHQITKESIVCSPSKYLNLEGINVVGERINPTGKARFKRALINNNFDHILKIAVEQVDGGADILDINLGLPEINEKKMMIKLIKELQGILDIPLQIDSSNLEVIKGALRYYNGIAIVNSVNGEKKTMNEIFPLIKKYGAYVVALTMDENGIPKTAEKRLEIAKKILNEAKKHGIEKDKVIIDCLTLTASTQQEGVGETLKAMKMVKEDLEVKTILGISNISFGLPNRKVLNRSFLSMALANELNLAIIDPNDKEMMETIKAGSVLNNYDKGAEEYIKFMSNENNSTIFNKKDKENYDLKKVIINGLKEKARKLTEKLLNEKDAMEIINDDLITALDIVGDKYEKNEIFLPQLVQSAETVKVAFSVLKEIMIKKNENDFSKGKIILATVKGDVHDIGKNIVKTVLENYGYKIIDLGRSVPIEEIVRNIKENDIKLIGLSALMTSTVENMQKTIKVIKSESENTKIMVGGAVLTKDYAKMINADFYAKDARDGVKIAEIVFNG